MSKAIEAPGWIYWAVAVVLIAFGTLTGFSIGIPFLFLGLALVFLAPFRKREVIFVPALLFHGRFAERTWCGKERIAQTAERCGLGQVLLHGSG